jgi:hypothetical protein
MKVTKQDLINLIKEELDALLEAGKRERRIYGPGRTDPDPEVTEYMPEPGDVAGMNKLWFDEDQTYISQLHKRGLAKFGETGSPIYNQRLGEFRNKWADRLAGNVTAGPVAGWTGWKQTETPPAPVARG